MNRIVLLSLLVSGAGSFIGAAAQEADSASVEQLNEVVVQAVRVPSEAPFAVSKINRKELQTFARTGQEMPMLLSRTPGVTAWTENGLGTGTASMRMRGSGASRINVTLDGISLNSPDDQCVFWVNMNSYASMLSNVQIQRGVGTSTNGDGAFGGTVALTMAAPSTQPFLDLTGSYGSYNTWNAGGNFSTGLLGNHLIFDGAYHHTGTDGYIHGTSGNSGSYYGGLTWLSSRGDIKISYKNIGNYEHTGQAWNGVTAGNGDYSLNAYDGIQSYKDMYKAGLGRYNDLWEDFQPDWAGGWTTQRYQMADGTPWPKTTDNFWQNRSHLSLAYRISEHWNLAGTLHYTLGSGYYNEFRPANKLEKFGLSRITLSDGSTLKKTDFVRKKGMDQDTYGMAWSANYQNRLWDVVGGAAFQKFQTHHWGYLTYVANPELRQQILVRGNYQFYDSTADKSDISLFLKALRHLGCGWNAFADLQYRHVAYATGGIYDRFVKQPDGTLQNYRLAVDKHYNFLNPKAGLSYQHNGHQAYLSYAMAHREPERNNFTDNGSYPAPHPELLHDLEGGYSYQGSRWHAGAGLYAMFYHNQFVQTGLKSDIGEYLTTNVHRSHRLGVELTAGVDVAKWLSLEANAALSQNRITDFDEVVETYDADWNDLPATTVHYDNSTLAFSPSAVLNGFADFRFGPFQATWHTGYVSRQYLDNTENRARSLDAYTRTDIHFSYNLPIARRGLKSMRFGLDLGNIFNARYASNGWVYSAIVGNTYPEAARYYQIGYYPSAGFTLMGNVSLHF